MKKYTIEEFLDCENIFCCSVSHDDTKALIIGNKTGLFSVRSIDLETLAENELTPSSKDSISDAVFFPGDNRVLFMRGQGGNELDHIYLLLENGEITDLTPYDKSKNVFFQWSYDGKSFFYRSNARDPRFFDLFEMELTSFEPKLIYENRDGLNVTAISPCKNYITLSRYVERDDCDLLLYNCTTGDSIEISDAGRKKSISYRAACFSHDGQSLYFLCNEQSEFSDLYSYDLESGESTFLKTYGWDINEFNISRNGRFQATITNEDSRSKVYLWDNKEKVEIQISEVNHLHLSGFFFSGSEQKLLFYAGSSNSTKNLYSYDILSKTSRQLTHTMTPSIDLNDLVEPEIVRYKSFDGLEIPALFYLPKTSEKKPFPALVMVHGGPGGQFTDTYSGLMQFLLNRNVAVIAVNNRGSSGYGNHFFNLDRKKHGKDDLMDCIYAKKYLAQHPQIDPARIGILGGSYGGFMVLAALAFQPDEFSCGIDFVGVSNWIRTLKQMPTWWEAFKKAMYKYMGDPNTEEDYLRSISPLFHAEKIKKPLMVLQGANDPRVLKEESDEIVEAVKMNNVPVEYALFEDEGHGITKKKNQERSYKAIWAFIKEYL